MKAEVGLPQYYEHFKSSNIKELEEVNKQLDEKRSIAEDFRRKLDMYKPDINDAYGIDLDKYDIWINHAYNKDDKLIPLIVDKLSVNNSDIILRVIATYINTLEDIYNLENAKYIITDKMSISFLQYKRYVSMFYRYALSKCIIKGDCYTAGNNLCNIIAVHRHKEDGFGRVNFGATNANKRRIINSGGIAYNKTDAAIAEANGEEYKGQEYIVYGGIKDYDTIHVFNINSTNKRSRRFTYFVSPHIGMGCRGTSLKDIAATCKTPEDVFRLPISLKYKIVIYNLVFPGTNLNYIRDVKQKTFTDRELNSKNRQRL